MALSAVMSSLHVQSGSNRISTLRSLGCLVIAFGLLASSILAQVPSSPIDGTVTTKEGQPLAGVLVNGSMVKTCRPAQVPSCRFKPEEATTDQEGRFHLEHPGGVIHFFKTGLQPQSFVVKPAVSEVHISLGPSIGTLVVPSCGMPGRGHKRIGHGKYGLQFDVPTRDVKIRGGSDIDYVRYVIKRKAAAAYLELSFGIYAMNLDPDDDMFMDSVTFAQRDMVNSDGETTGLDSSGQLRSGGSWRQTAIVGEGGSRYKNARPEEAGFFDQVVNSICSIPYPKH
jgi:hypothetical protein